MLGSSGFREDVIDTFFLDILAIHQYVFLEDHGGSSESPHLFGCTHIHHKTQPYRLF